ncbi:bifunctional 2-keto-4-hydroxyglutarate aldolase/2-keto-3-deoxy-6-phosphogluconate aldolase [Streptococcus catagoni]|uniref:bifunctional 2-keto-4-hydroxyglutarate aldolase/2-keto-3-deoxy-6-phosphogluconate aldolase n=1 Tax=Streptococcus catagoni TaxID=2654874 RepID=UPI00140D033A|nr:bifunctional 2-keto-4-hydroxyglutarate aldolase/2-keto-3-deoxy-6-phosphogluconate aldolase [Streptococcus catagoni]
MTKSEILLSLLQKKIVPVIRGDNKEEAIRASKACIEGGISCIEVAYTNKDASLIIESLTMQYQASQKALIGAGTVLDAETARLAIMAGAQFIVSPAFNPHTAIICNRYAIPYLPGCMTITEITKALEYGCELVKIFPGGTVGSSFIKALRSPLPQVRVMITGGVNLDNAQDWFKTGASAIGIGGEFNQLAKEGKFDQITEMAKKYTQLLNL